MFGPRLEIGKIVVEPNQLDINKPDNASVTAVVSVVAAAAKT